MQNYAIGLEDDRARLRGALAGVVLERLRPAPRMTVSEWADERRYLSAEASAEPGKWRTERVEYLRGILDAFSDPRVRSVVVMSSSQVGKTEVVLNVVGYHVDQDPAPILVVQPTLEMAETFSKDRLAPMLRDTPVLQGKVKDARSRDSENTLLHKAFPGGRVTLAGANSPASLASRPIRVVLCDEVDRYPPSAGAEGDPVSLARKRSTTFWNRKDGQVSTPTVKGASRIEMAYEESDRRHFMVPCPHCAEPQQLKWAQVRWPDGKPREALYVCEACGAGWTDVERWLAVRRGAWEASAEFRGVAGFHLNEIYSPWVRLADMVEAFLEAKKNPETLKAFVNTSLGESFEDTGERPDAHKLMDRVEAWGPKVPAGVLVITVGVDAQDDRLELEFVGWGVDEESWSLGYRILYGDPSAPALWADLDLALGETFETEDGRKLLAQAICVDSGGHHTQAVYNYAKTRAKRRVWAIKGMAGPGRPVWPPRASKNNKQRVNLFLIGVDAAKEAVYNRLKVANPGPGYCHIPKGRELTWFEQLTSETLVTTYSKGRAVRSWQKRAGVRNEALDVRCYAYAALQSLNVIWKRLAAAAGKAAERAEAVTPPPSEVDVPENALAPAAEAPRRQRQHGPRRSGSNWVNGWR